MVTSRSTPEAGTGGIRPDSERARPSGRRPGAIRSLLELGKPRITLFVVLTAGMGVWLSPASPSPGRAAAFLAATALLVASANTLNCWIERFTDGRMRRTRDRALPSGRLAPPIALVAGVLEGLVAVPALAAATNPLTALLGAVALLTYVLLYTPLKRISPWSVVVGAVPGALPPAMGWTAGGAGLDASAWALFGILFFWQLPHFIAISIYLAEDYRRGGLQVLPVARGRNAAKHHLLLYTAGLVAVSLAVVPLGLAGFAYLVAAAVLGAAFLALAVTGLRRAAGVLWARRTFLYSLVYLTGLVGALLLDAR